MKVVYEEPHVRLLLPKFIKLSITKTVIIGSIDFIVLQIAGYLFSALVCGQ